MRFDAGRLYGLLPAVDRVRDAERGEPLRALLDVIASQVAIVEENQAQRYDDQFIETCAEWVVPYIGDLLGVRGLYGVSSATLSQRALVANTIGYRRRKGTAVMLQQLAHDVTGWDARVVEYFFLLGMTQWMNHVRLGCTGTADLRDALALGHVGTPFDPVMRAVDVRRIASGRGRYNIPNVGLTLWPLAAYRLRNVPPVRVDDYRYFFDPLGGPARLVTRPLSEEYETHSATPFEVPAPIGRRMLAPEPIGHLSDYYGADLSVVVTVAGVAVPPAQIQAADLSDDGSGGWTHSQPHAFCIDPVLGRLALPSADALPAAGSLRVTYHYGFSAPIGGGEYDRTASFTVNAPPAVPPVPERVPNPRATIMAALGAVAGGGLVVVDDSNTYVETPAVTANAGARVELRAADLVRPVLSLGGELVITGGDQADITINGLVIAGGAVRVTGTPATVKIRHCTLVPGLARDADGQPVHGTAPSLVIDAPDARVIIDASILGGVRAAIGSSVTISNSIVDATADDGVAYAAGDGAGPGGALTLSNSTLFGKVHADAIPLITNSILTAALGMSDSWPAAIWCSRRQEGCVRFSYLPLDAIVPRRFECQPDGAAVPTSMRPQFGSRRYGDAEYCRLTGRTPNEIAQGADDESEGMGVFHDVFAARRVANLRTRLDEYLRFSLEAGVFSAGERDSYHDAEDRHP